MPTKIRIRSEQGAVAERGDGFALALDGDERSEELASASAARPLGGAVEPAVDRAGPPPPPRCSGDA